MGKILLLIFICLSTPSFGGFSRDEEIKKMRSDFRAEDRVRLAYRTDAAIEGWVHTAVRELRKGGSPEQMDYADQIMEGWEGVKGIKGLLPSIVLLNYHGYIELREVPEMYAPMSALLSDWYHDVKELLGPTVTHALRLDDIQVLNYSVPIVFSLEDVLGAGVTIDLPTYTVYWTPFLGVVAYWSVWAVCEAATYGTGYVLLCMPVGMLAERITITYIAPPLADNMYAKFWP